LTSIDDRSISPPNQELNTMPKPAQKLTQSSQDKRSSHPSHGKTPLQSKIIATKTENPQLNNTQIGKLINTPRETVSKVLTRYGIDMGAVESYQKHRADIFDALQHRIIASVTDDDINKATLMQRMASVGVLYDKMRIERGLSDSSSKPLVQINIVSPAGPMPSITCNAQVIDNTTHDVVSHNNIPPNIPPIIVGDSAEAGTEL
jgi:hypothetical protein